MLPEMNIGFLKNCLIELLSKEPKTIGELVEATNFGRSFVIQGLSLLQDEGVAQKGEYKILREPTKTVKGLRSETYRLTKMWQDVYS